MPGFEGRTLLDRYQVEEFIGRGGMSDVYRVYDQVMNVPLAMKVLHEDLADDPVIMRSFEREARALKKLGHPNIVPFYGIEETQDAVFLLVHYIDGPTLKKILSKQKGQPLSVMESLTYLRAVSAALGYAHQMGVVHCDMKPGNVMVDRGGNIYLTDFGIARHAESSRTSLGGAVGTAYYMAPEQFVEEIVTPATDVYALGVFLFELLTGQRPFQGDGGSTESQGSTRHQRIMHAHMKLAPPDPRSINPKIPDALAQVVLKAMQKDPKDRYISAQDMFNAACGGAGVQPENVPDRATFQAEKLPPPPPPGSQPPPPIPNGKGRRKTGLYVLVVGGVLALMLIGYIIINNKRSNGVTTVTPSKVPSQSAAEIVPTVTPVAIPTVSPTPIPTDTPAPTIPPINPTVFCHKSPCGSYNTCLRTDMYAYVRTKTAIYSIPRYKPAENNPYPTFDWLDPGTRVRIIPKFFDQCYANSHYWYVELDNGDNGFVLEYYQTHKKDNEIPSNFPQLFEGYYLSPYAP